MQNSKELTIKITYNKNFEIIHSTKLKNGKQYRAYPNNKPLDTKAYLVEHYYLGTLSKQRVLHPNGHTNTEIPFSHNHIINGTLKTFDTDGRLISTTKYVKGKKYGPSIIYNPDTNEIINTTYFIKDVPTTADFFENMTAIQEQNFLLRHKKNKLKK